MGKFIPVRFTRFPQCVRPTCLFDFAVHGLEPKLRFERFRKGQTDNDSARLSFENSRNVEVFRSDLTLIF